MMIYSWDCISSRYVRNDLYLISRSRCGLCGASIIWTRICLIAPSSLCGRFSALVCFISASLLVTLFNRCILIRYVPNYSSGCTQEPCPNASLILVLIIIHILSPLIFLTREFAFYLNFLAVIVL